MKKTIQIFAFLFSLASFSQPGTLDTTFGIAGKLQTTGGRGYGLVIQPDGKILVAGFLFDELNGGDNFVCVRYNTNGTLDNAFGTNGIAVTNTLIFDEAYCLALQNDGKIVLAGVSTSTVTPKGALVRYNTDGSLDTSFGDSGVVITAFEPSQSSYIRAIKIDNTTGKIVVGGMVYATAETAKPVVARYNSNGTLDLSFNGTGIKTLWVEADDNQYTMSVEDLVVQPGGKISAIGWRNLIETPYMNDNWACRINNDGTMDTTFSTDGVAHYNGTFNGDDKSFSLLLKPDNTFVVAGNSALSGQDYAYSIFEISANGTLPSNQGAVSFNTQHQSFAYGLAMDGSGKYVLAGSTGLGNSNRTFALAMFNPDYTIDSSFGVNGKVTTLFETSTVAEAYDVAVQSDNKIVAVGYSGNNIALSRYNGANALLTNSFNTDDALTVYPNPAHDFLNIKLNNVENTKFDIVDVNGRVLVSGILLQENTQINIDYLSNGVYFFKVNTLNSVQKFIKK